MLKSLLIGLVALLALLVVVGFLLPDDTHVERSTVIDAHPCTIYAQLADFQRFNEWSPWAALDPDTQYTYSGADYGVGAKMSWVSENKNVGSGSQEIKAADPYKKLEVFLDFGEQGEADAYYTLDPEGGGTKVTWGFDTSFEGNIIGRYFGLFMDSMVGASYEEGLAKLKTLAEGLPDTDWCGYEIEIVDVDARWIAGTRGESGTTPEEIGPALGAAYGRIQAFLAEHQLEPTGPPLVVNEAWNDEGFRFLAGMPLVSKPELDAAEAGEVEVTELPAARAARILHKGSYAGIPSTYEALETYAIARGLEWPESGTWEQYLDDPGSTPEDQLRTHIFLPVGG